MESRKLVQMNLCAGQKQMQKQRMNMWTWGKGKLGWIGGVALPCLHHRMWNTPLLGAAPAQGAPRHALRGLRWAWSGGLEGGLQRERAYVYLHFLHTAVEQELPQHWEPITRQLNIILKKQPLFMKKLKTELPHESAIALCIHTPRENHNWKRHTHHNVHGSTTHKSQDMEATQMSIQRWMVEKMWYIHTMEYYSAIKRKEIGSFVDMDGTRVCCTEWSCK